MTTYHYRLAGTDMTVTLEVPEGKEPPSHVSVPEPLGLGYQRYQLVTPPEPKTWYRFVITWRNKQQTNLVVSNEDDAVFHARELTRDPQVSTVRLHKEYN